MQVREGTVTEGGSGGQRRDSKSYPGSKVRRGGGRGR